MVASSFPPASPPTSRAGGRRRLHWALLLALLLAAGALLAGNTLRGQEKPPARPVAFALLRVAEKSSACPQRPATRNGTTRRGPSRVIDKLRRCDQEPARPQRRSRQPEVAKLAVVREQTDPVAWLADNLRVDFQISANNSVHQVVDSRFAPSRPRRMISGPAGSPPGGCPPTRQRGPFAPAPPPAWRPRAGGERR